MILQLETYGGRLTTSHCKQNVFRNIIQGLEERACEWGIEPSHGVIYYLIADSYLLLDCRQKWTDRTVWSECWTKNIRLSVLHCYYLFWIHLHFCIYFIFRNKYHLLKVIDKLTSHFVKSELPTFLIRSAISHSYYLQCR